MNRAALLAFATALLLFLPGTAFAHSPGGFMLATLVVFIIAAGIALAIKRRLAKKLLPQGQAPHAGIYIGIAALEVFIMVLSFSAAIQISPSKHTLAILLVACLIYLAPACLVNFYLVRTTTLRSTKALLFAILSPASIWILAFVLFAPLYTLFGG